MGHIVPREVCIILLLSATSGIRVGDMIIQLVFFLVLIALVVGITSLVVKFKNRNKQLNRIEEKLDNLVSDKKE